jgi:hypothetical protein
MYTYKIGEDFSPLSNVQVVGAVTEVVIPSKSAQGDVFILGTQLDPEVTTGYHGLPEALPVEVKSPYKIAIEG